MALASSLMSDIGNIIGKEKEALKYAEISTFLRDSYLLDSMHWSQEHNAYLDYGLHTEGVRLQRPPPPKGQPMQHNQDKIRVVTIEPKLQYVNQLGYISLFPFILGVLDPKSPKIPNILDSIEDPNKLFTPFGLRSLSKDASLYNKKNTEHDAPYWRGPIWININFLVVRALYNLKEDMGVDKSGNQKDGFEPGIELLGKVTVFAEGCRGHLGKHVTLPNSSIPGSKPSF
jgi:mannosyl-oligosaccharide glucosidase